MPESSFIRLVRTELHEARPVQQALFANAQSNSLVFANIRDASGEGLARLLSTCITSAVVDMRPVPYFSSGPFSRKAALSIIRRRKLVHLEFGFEMNLGTSDARYLSGELSTALAAALKNRGVLSGPLLFLFDSSSAQASAEATIPRTLNLDGRDLQWSVLSEAVL
ncbi:MAG: hypothetical protein U0228_25540 [Myxococcaceae bacterium]